MSSVWENFLSGLMVGLILGGGFLLSYSIVTSDEPEICQERCVKGYTYLVCDSGVVQVMAGDGDNVYLVKCQNEDHN